MLAMLVMPPDPLETTWPSPDPFAVPLTHLQSPACASWESGISGHWLRTEACNDNPSADVRVVSRNGGGGTHTMYETFGPVKCRHREHATPHHGRQAGDPDHERI